MTTAPSNFDELHRAVKAIAGEVAAPSADAVDADARFPHETLDALRAAGALSAGVPRELGGGGCTLAELSALCATLAAGCAASGMVLAMHYIQVACIARHAGDQAFWLEYQQELVRTQSLLASMTSENGTFGNTRASICALQAGSDEHSFRLDKDATTGSYCAHADGILVTCRRSPDSPEGDQALVLVRRGDYELEQSSTWDTLGMRGTCSPGFKLRSTGARQQVLPSPFADISAETMVPYSHVLWSALWSGIAGGAVAKAAAFVRGQARKNPGTLPGSAGRLAAVSSQLQASRLQWMQAASDFDATVQAPQGRRELQSMAWALRLNNLKITASEAAPRIVHEALQVIGILAYKNDGPFSLGRHYRDALSASLMISNDRIAAKNAAMLMIFKDE